MHMTGHARKQRTYTIPATEEELHRVDALIEGMTVGGSQIPVSRGAMIHNFWIRGMELAEEERRGKKGSK